MDQATAQGDSGDGQANKREAPRVRLAARPLIVLIRLYQVTLGMVLGGQCRFIPSCSEYSIEALQQHGVLYGSWLTMRRILRCHPFGGHGYDPVPPARPHGRAD